MAIEKLTYGLFIVLALATGCVFLIGDVATNYGVVNTTGYVYEVSQSVTGSVNDLSNYTGTFQASVNGVEEASTLGIITGSVIGAITLPFQLVYIALKGIVLGFKVLSLPQIIFTFLLLLISVAIIYAILKLIFNRSGEM
jgi:hypothetical protein